MTALTPHNCCKASIAAQSNVGPRIDELESNSRRDNCVSGGEGTVGWSGKSGEAARDVSYRPPFRLFTDLHRVLGRVIDQIRGFA